MNSTQVFDPVSLFYSYSHRDEQFRDELEKHLSTLRRLGQIRSWHDRRIGPGDEWKQEIDQNLKSADIILLLISPDFIASEYCYAVETELALKRHNAKEATVIPVLLRPVDFKGLPFADLQMLPKDTYPIAKWASVDDAYKNVAEGIREAVRRVADRRVSGLDLAVRPSLSEARALDAAVAREIPVGEFREVLSVIRLTDSEGLRFAISQDQGGHRHSYSCEPTDVRSEAFQARYSAAASGEVTSAEYRLAIHAPDLIVEGEEKKFVLEPRCDSGIFKFLMKAEREGEHRLRVDLYSKGLNIAENLLKTAVTESKRPGGGVLASVELVVRALTRAASSGASQ